MQQSQDDQLAIVLGQRQLIAVFCMFLSVLGLVGSLAYVTGRSITAAQMENRSRANQPPALVVDSAAPPAPLQARAEALPSRHTPPAVPRPLTLPPAKPVPPPPAPVAATAAPAVTSAAQEVAEPSKGQSFWQVGVVDPGMAPVFVEYMQKLGMPAQMAPGPSPTSRRILVGPLAGQTQIQQAKQTLDKAGMQAFLKTY